MRGVIGAGVEGFVYHPPHVRTPLRMKSTNCRGGKSPKTAVCLRDQLVVEGAEVKEEAKGVETVPPELLHTSEEEGEQKEDGKENRRGRKLTPLQTSSYKFAQSLLKGSGITTSW